MRVPESFTSPRAVIRLAAGFSASAVLAVPLAVLVETVMGPGSHWGIAIQVGLIFVLISCLLALAGWAIFTPSSNGNDATGAS